MAAKKNPKEKKSVDLKENPTYAVDMTTLDERGIFVPDQDIPESEKDFMWYVRNIHYIATFYNVPFENVLAPSAANVLNPTYENGPFDLSKLPVNRMLRYMQYYQGRQDNLDYNNWTTNNVTSTNLQAQWIKGQDIFELIQFMKGNMLERISNIQITAQALSEGAVSEMQDFRTNLLMKYKFTDIFADMANKGTDFAVGPQEGFDSEEAIDDFMEKNFKQYGVDVAIAMAKNFWYTNYCLGKFLRLFVECTITGVAATQHYVQNGKQYMRTIPSYQMILDTRHDDDYNRDAQFVGIVETMTAMEVFARFPKLTKEQRDEIQRISKNKNLGTQYNQGFTNINWWNYNSKRNQCTITVVTAYWIGRHDMGLRKVDTQYGTQKIEKTKKSERGEYIIDDIYKGTLIGNRFLTDWGYDDNVVEDYQDKSKPMFPIIRYLPNMVGGEPRSVVSRLYQLQDELDALNYKVREMVGRAKGKVYIVKSTGGNNMDTKQMYEDFASMGMTVIPSATGENLPGQDQKIIEGLDYTLDPNVIQIENMIKQRRDIMKEFTSVSNVSLGMQTSYMGMGERTAAISQSTYGLAYLYHGFMDFIQHNLQYAVNVAKNLYTMDGNTEAAMVIGDKGVAYLKIMEDLKFEDFLIMLKLNDIIDEAGRKEMNQLALAWAQNGLIDPEIYIKVRKQQTFSDAERVLEYAMEKKKKEAAQQRAEAAQQEQVLQAQALEAKQKDTMLQQAGADNRENIKADSKIKAAAIQKIPEG
jgi:hypothetical protein